MRRRSLGIGALALAMLSCGSDPQIEASVATLRSVRGAITLGEAQPAPLSRVAAGDAIGIGDEALARLELDGGARLVLASDTRLRVTDEATLEIERGRAHVEARAPVEIAHPRASLRLAGSSASIDADEQSLRAYVIRGELAYVAGETRGVVEAGHRLVVDGEGARTEPVALFSDWTAGLAEAGPEHEVPVGVGMLEARVPDEVGRARWPLVVRRLDVRVRVEGDLAITEIDQEFFNPASEMLEGLYRVRVPAGSILSRFAVDRDGRLVDGYVRERGQAQRAYEEQVYRGSTLDPALLEWDGPDAYRARIYPIHPGQTRRIVVRWTEWLRAPAEGAPRTYRFPMGGSDRAPRISELSIDVDLAAAGASRVRAGLGAIQEGGSVRLRRSDFVPRSDFWLELFSDGARSQRAWRAPHRPPPRDPGSRAIANEADERDYWVAPIVLPAALATSESEGLDVVVVADLSAGTDRARLELGRSAVEALASLLGSNDRLAVLAADVSLRPLDGEPALGPVTEDRVESALSALARAPAEGATDLGETIARAAALLDPARSGVVVYVGDGRATVGDRTARALSERIARLPRPVRLYAIAVGEDSDVELLSPALDHGGLVLRIEERRDAAEAALDLLAHAARQVVHGVTIELGDGIENRYPRRPIDVVLGDVLPIVGRVRGEPPRSILVRGTHAGRPFEHELELETIETEDTTDPRLRWASARLAQLLAEGASREEIVELGVRQGVITPYTSYYVPSASELSRLEDIPSADVLPSMDPNAPPPPVVATPVAPMAAPATMPAPRAAGSAAAAEAAAPVMPEPAAAEPMEPRRDRVMRSARPLGDDDSPRGALAPRVTSAARAAAARCASSASGVVVVSIAIDASGRVTSASVARSSLADPAAVACIVAALRALRFDSGPLTVSVPITVAGTAGPRPAYALALAQLGPYAFAAAAEEARADAHRTRRCSDASALPLDERRELWRERLDAHRHWSEVYREARRECELGTWRDRRALLAVILEHAGSVPAMIEVARALTASSDRAFARGAILQRVRTPEDVRAVRAAFGDEAAYDRIADVLERASDPRERVSLLRRFVEQYPGSVELKLRLLEELEAAGLDDAALRLAHAMRVDPLSDAGVRTAIGELLLRRGREDDARRAFSEIVEHAPQGELARRRLGDLYLAHGWMDDAYRQYETLRDLRPDDPSVLLSLARAAAGAGRVDEALRLEQRLSQTAEPGAASGIARVALLWSAVRYARLRMQASGDADRIAQLDRRRRRSGVLAHAAALRVTLTFAHPDAGVSLWAAHPSDGSLARPSDLAPEHGLEAFEARELDAGAYRVEVRRDPGALGAVDAELCVVWSEGRPEERVSIVPLRFEGERRSFAFRIDSGRLVSIAD